MGAATLRRMFKRFRPDEIRRAVLSSYALDLNKSFDSLVYVAGTRRSGTTWLAELINARNEHRMIFEPFHDRWGPFPETLVERYARPTMAYPELRSRVEQILLGKFRHAWSGRHNTKLISTKRLIKDIHTNLMLKWFRSEFPPFPIVLIIRHPCAVAQSNLRVQFDAELEIYLQQDELRFDYLLPFVGPIEAAETEFERLIFQWCIENYVPLRQFQDSEEIHVVLYESLVLRPAEELERLCTYLGKRFDDSILAAVERPSSTTWRAPREQLAQTRDAAFAWRGSVARDQIARSEEILTLFGLDGLYSSDGSPQTTGQLTLPNLGHERPGVSSEPLRGA